MPRVPLRPTTLVVPAGKTSVVFTISGGTGDADLYVRRGSAPTTSTYDCRPYLVATPDLHFIRRPRALLRQRARLLGLFGCDAEGHHQLSPADRLPPRGGRQRDLRAPALRAGAFFAPRRRVPVTARSSGGTCCGGRTRRMLPRHGRKDDPSPRRLPLRPRALRGAGTSPARPALQLFHLSHERLPPPDRADHALSPAAGAKSSCTTTASTPARRGTASAASADQVLRAALPPQRHRRQRALPDPGTVEGSTWTNSTTRRRRRPLPAVAHLSRE